MKKTVLSLLFAALSVGAYAAEDKTQFNYSVTRLSAKDNYLLEIQFTPPFQNTQGCAVSHPSIGVLPLIGYGHAYRNAELSFVDYVDAMAIDPVNPPTKLEAMFVFDGCTGSNNGDASDRAIITSVRVRATN